MSMYGTRNFCSGSDHVIVRFIQIQIFVYSNENYHHAVVKTFSIVLENKMFDNDDLAFID